MALVDKRTMELVNTIQLIFDELFVLLPHVYQCVTLHRFKSLDIEKDVA